MGTEAQQFFQSNVDQDGTWGTDIVKLQETTSGVVSTTVAQHPNSAGTTTITLDPYSPRSTQGDATTLFGWAINSGADGMESTTTAKRRILAGTWRFFNRVSVPAGGTVSGSHNVTAIYSVYRVSADGATRTLLFSYTSPEDAGTLLASTATFDNTTPAQDEIVLETGETIHVGIQSRNRQVAGALGATTAGNLTWHTGGAADAFVEVPAPGIRTLFFKDMTLETAAAADAPITRLLYLPREMPETVQGTDLMTPVARSLKTGREIVENELTTDALARVYRSFRTLAESVPIGTETLARLFKGSRATTAESIPTTTTLATSFKGDRSITESVPTSDVSARKFSGTRGLSETTAVSDVLNRLALLRRVLSEVTTTVDITLDRGTLLGRTNVESIPTVGVLTRLIKQRRFLAEYPTGVTPDYNVEFPQRKIAGIVRDQNGDPYEGAVVKLFRGQDDKMVQETVSAADGSYLFLRDLYDPFVYYVQAYEETDEPTAGVTERGLVPENV